MPGESLNILRYNEPKMEISIGNMEEKIINNVPILTWT